MLPIMGGVTGSTSVMAWCGHYIVFLGKTLHPRSASLNPGGRMGNGVHGVGITLEWASYDLTQGE